MRKVELVLSMFPGDGQAVLYFEDTQRRLGTPCVVHPALVNEMKELLVFSRTLNESGNYIRENSPVLVTGKISVRDEKEPQILCDSLRPLGDLEEELRKTAGQGRQKLYLKIPCREDPRMRKVELVLSMFPGDGQAVLYFEDTHKRLGTPCVVHPALVSEMKGLLGPDRVVVK